MEGLQRHVPRLGWTGENKQAALKPRTAARTGLRPREDYATAHDALLQLVPEGHKLIVIRTW
ncbi:hypothetical protein DQ354_19375 [Arthrobacter sp. AQ5-06]|nr:hypothetical protein DQ354_19375 [Arthrobacter sp. AQ5-06]